MHRYVLHRQPEKGVGKLWQFAPCDAASSYALAKVVPANNATEAAAFLRQVVVPEVEKAGWKLQCVLTDGGSEFKGAFDQACRELNVQHTRTRPRHAWTNGFVERLQGTILHEHWRIAFRNATSDGDSNCKSRSSHFCCSTTLSGLTRDTEPRDEHPLRSSGGASANAPPSRTEVSTPLRDWTS